MSLTTDEVPSIGVKNKEKYILSTEASISSHLKSVSHITRDMESAS